MNEIVVSYGLVECKLTVVGTDKFKEFPYGAQDIQFLDKEKDYTIHSFSVGKVPMKWLLRMSQKYTGLVFQLEYYDTDRELVNKVIVEKGISFEWAE
jgi:hypothetical protein